AGTFGIYTVLNLLQDRVPTGLYATWGRLAGEFAAEPAVAGFDLMNEPAPGEQPPLTSSLLLGRDYAEAIAAIRAAESAARGFPHLIFFQPSALWSELGFDAAPPPGFSADANLVFAPHPPPDSTLVSIQRGLAMSARMAGRYRAALWIGEWSGDPRRYATAEDEGLIGGAFRVVEGQPAVLSRAYPRAAPGRLTALWSGTERRGLRLSGTGGGGNCDLDVWVPGEERPAVASTGISSVAFREVTGGWRISGCPSGDYRLELV
ncbi:MAG TPA: cellulase family glycosylhydrolase, partial [Trebonia sp.]